MFKPLTLPLRKLVKDTEETLLESDEDIKHALTETYTAGHIDEEEKELLHKALDMDEISIKDIMVPMKEVQTIDYDATRSQIKSIVTKSSHTRFPVIKDGDIVGILNAALFLKNEVNKVKFNIEDAMYDVSQLQGNTKLDIALQVLRSKRQKLAIVLHTRTREVIGILTIEDILEELVGELYDESDSEENGIMQIEEDHFIVNYAANAKEVMSVVYNSRKKVDEKIKFGDYLKQELKIKTLNDGERVSFRNSLV
jgi:CBS domain containing-hemolysin-like protein